MQGRKKESVKITETLKKIRTTIITYACTMIHVLQTESFVSYYPRYQINNMKAKLFGDSERGEIRGGGALPQGHPNKSQKYLFTVG